MGKYLKNNEHSYYFKKLSFDQQKEYVKKLARPEYKNIVTWGNKENVTTQELMNLKNTQEHTWRETDLIKWQSFYDRIQKKEDDEADELIQNDKTKTIEQKTQSNHNVKNREFWRGANRNYTDVLNLVQRLVGDEEEWAKIEDIGLLDKAIDDDLKYTFDEATGATDWGSIGNKDYATIEKLLWTLSQKPEVYQKVFLQLL